MRQENGWIKLHRKVIDWEWFDCPHMFRLFFYLLVSANVEDKRWRGRIIQRGDFVTSLNALSSRLDISLKNVRTCLERLKSTKEIEIKTTNKFSIITICNYDKYQCYDKDDGQAKGTQEDTQKASKGQAKGTQRATTKEYKNIRIKEKERSIIINNNTKKEKPPKIDFGEIKEFFNHTMTGKMIPCINAITKQREAWLNARLKDYTIEQLYEAFTKAAESKFLNGDNRQGFRATFDWIVRPNNFPKILEGNYDDRKSKPDNSPEASRNPLEGYGALNG